jgi:hypothetical protein
MSKDYALQPNFCQVNNRAFAQPCAICSPGDGILSVIAMLRQQSFNMTELRNGATGFRSNLMLLDSFYVIGG